MSKMKWYTRADSDPFGKQKLFFLCHPDSVALCREKMIQDILSLQNCVIYCYEQSEMFSENELQLNISQMQIVVIAITERFLRETDRFSVAVMALASEMHIPVLPVLFEPHLDRLFESTFGDLQYIDAVTVDETGIPYQERLAGYFDRLLFGTELIDRVKKNFHGSIFLSYRKKDRIYAHKLMKTIHAYPFMRNIAIWYDEWLIPGEGFNHAIEEAIEECSLFCLAVTDHLAEPGNYVMRIEYPMACTKGKDIMAVEMQPIHYDFPFEVIDIREMQGILMQVFSDQKPMASEEMYLTGMAYLNGIEVEVNHEYAVSMIENSAEQNNVEAIERLITMYHSGQGVKRDFMEAIRWRKTLLENLDDELHYVDELNNLAEAYIEVHMLEEAYETGLKAYEHHLSDKADAIFAVLLGDIRKDQGLFREAMDYFRVAEGAAEKLSARDEHDWICSICCDRIGDILVHLERYQEALQEFEKGLDYRRTDENYAKSAVMKRSEAVSLGRIADVLSNLGLYEDALTYYEQACDLQTKVSEEMRTAGTAEDLCLTYIHIGNTYRHLHMPILAERAYLTAKEIIEDLEEETGTMETKRIVSDVFLKRGNLYFDSGRLEEAHDCYNASVKICEEIFAGGRTYDSIRDLAVGYDGLGQYYHEMGDFQNAHKNFAKAIKLLDELPQDEISPGRLTDVSIMLSRIAGVYAAQGNTQMAETLLKRCIDLDLEHLQATGSDHAKKMYAISLEKMGDVSNAVDGLPFHLKSLELRRQLMEDKHSLCASLNRVGSDYFSVGNYEEAHRCFDEMKTLAQDMETDQLVNDYAAALTSIGDIGAIYGETEAALECYLTAAELMSGRKTYKAITDRSTMLQRAARLFLNKKEFDQAEKAASQAMETIATLPKTPDCFTCWIVSKDLLGDIYQAKNDLSSAMECYQEICEYSKEAFVTVGGRFFVRTEAIGHIKRADILKENDRTETAQEEYLQALAILRKHQDNWEDDMVLGTLGDVLERLGSISVDQKFEYMHECVELRSRIARQFPSFSNVKAYDIGLIKLGRYYQLEGDSRNAEYYYRCSLDLRKQLDQQFHTLDTKDNLANVYWALATAVQDGDEPPYLRKAIELLEDLSRMVDDKRYEERIAYLRGQLDRLTAMDSHEQ